MALKRAVFLDKDGTLLENVPYNVDPLRMRPATGVIEGLHTLSRTAMPLIVISNQAGLALGKFDDRALEPMVQRLKEIFSEAGAEMVDFLYCPHHPAAVRPELRLMCECRKPRPGLFQAAAAKHGIDLSQSWMVGDILDDIEAGHRAGCRSILVDNGNETEWQAGLWREPDHTVANFAEAANIVAAHVQQDAGAVHE